MDKKRIIIAVVVFIVLLCGIGLIFFFTQDKKEGKKEKLNVTKEEMEEKINTINDNMLSRDADLDAVSKAVGYEVDGTWSFLGPDSLYEFKLPDSVKNGENYDDYEKLQDEFLKKLDELLNSNFQYEIINHQTTEYSVIDTVRVKTFYGILYSMDQNALMNRILIMGGYDPDKMITNNEWQIAYYKAKIKSMQILDQHIDFYSNDDEYITFDIIYDMTDDGLVCYNCNDYFEILKAYNSSKVDMSSEESMNQFYTEQDTRIQGYLDQAIQSGMLDEKNPFDV